MLGLTGNPGQIKTLNNFNLQDIDKKFKRSRPIYRNSRSRNRIELTFPVWDALQQPLLPMGNMLIIHDRLKIEGVGCVKYTSIGQTMVARQDDYFIFGVGRPLWPKPTFLHNGQFKLKCCFTVLKCLSLKLFPCVQSRKLMTSIPLQINNLRNSKRFKDKTQQFKTPAYILQPSRTLECLHAS